MSQLQVFENELFKVSAKNENGQILFEIEQVAKCLGITQEKNNREYVRWERVNEYLPPNSPEVGKGDLIPEPLVYKLAFKASNEVAEQFQDWLAIEVIPSIRNTGSYKTENVVPLSKDQALVTVLRTTADLVEGHDEIVKEQHEIRKLVTQIDEKVEEQITLDHGEQRRLQKAVATKVYELSDEPNERSQLFREIYREIKDRFAVASYKDVKRKELQVAIRYVANWIPRKVS
ncbi:phage antirepressor [Ammoniphilus oxalaticus]|uniref:Phage antirepressor n=1 Tax=Ammoniphilus oxalaticus TaxID=66863 RepID=A0A419SFL7_9BACL|nr:ORF6C domain-containing protein [Ammoniphilus oxalaticus]RKD22583.1 phage antirepressor [Ammoniphilus oxalaticus]